MDDSQPTSPKEKVRPRVQKLVSELDSLDKPADERQFVEAVLHTCEITHPKSIFITDDADPEARNPLAERVLMPKTADCGKVESARLMLEVGDELRGSDQFLDDSSTHQSESAPRLRDRITRLWDR